jgi:hypothetical protein
MKRGRKMKKLLKVVVSVAVVAVIAIMAKNTVVANAEAVDEKDVTDVVVDNAREDVSEEVTAEEITEETDDLITFRLMVDRIEYLSFRKGHDGEYTLEYSVNDGPKQRVIMGVLGLELFNCVPTYVSHFYDIENVKMGDVITYTYSYYNTYFQVKDPCVVKGTQVVDKALEPSEDEQ